LNWVAGNRLVVHHKKMSVGPVAVLTCKAGVRSVPVQTVECHVTLVDTYGSEACDTLVGMAALVAVAAVDVAAGGGSCRFSSSVIVLPATHDIAQSTQRSAAVRADEVSHMPAQTLRLDTFVTKDYLHVSIQHHQLSYRYELSVRLSYKSTS